MDLESRSVCDLLGVSFMTLFLLVYYVPETIQLQRSLKGTMIQGQSHLAVLIMTHINNLKQRRSSDPRGRNQMRVRPLVIVSSQVQTEKLEVHSCTNSTPPLCRTSPPVCTCTQYTFFLLITIQRVYSIPASLITPQHQLIKKMAFIPVQPLNITRRNRLEHSFKTAEEMVYCGIVSMKAVAVTVCNVHVQAQLQMERKKVADGGEPIGHRPDLRPVLYFEPDLRPVSINFPP